MSLTAKEWMQAVNAIANASIGNSPGFGTIVRLESVLNTLRLYAETGAYFELGSEGKVVFGFQNKEPEKPQ